jgi:hypothetical protein
MKILVALPPLTGNLNALLAIGRILIAEGIYLGEFGPMTAAGKPLELSVFHLFSAASRVIAWLPRRV